MLKIICYFSFDSGFSHFASTNVHKCSHNIFCYAPSDKITNAGVDKKKNSGRFLEE